MSEEIKEDLTPYTNIDDVLHYSCFITPDGTFYRVRKTETVEMDDEFKYKHSSWAQKFVSSTSELKKRFIKIKSLKEANPNFKRFYTEYDFLLKECGWIAYTGWLQQNREKEAIEEYYVCLPFVCKKEQVYTPIQIKMIKQLAKENAAKPSDSFLSHIRWSGEFAATWYRENLLEENNEKYKTRR